MATSYRTSATIQDLSTSKTYGDTKASLAQGDYADERILNIGTTEETVTLSPDVADGSTTHAHLLVIINKDPTNFVEMGYATGNYPNKLLPGVGYLVGLNNTKYQLFLKADTAACRVQFRAIRAA